LEVLGRERYRGEGVEEKELKKLEKGVVFTTPAAPPSKTAGPRVAAVTSSTLLAGEEGCKRREKRGNRWKGREERERKEKMKENGSPNPYIHAFWVDPNRPKPKSKTRPTSASLSFFSRFISAPPLILAAPPLFAFIHFFFFFHFAYFFHAFFSTFYFAASHICLVHFFFLHFILILSIRNY